MTDQANTNDIPEEGTLERFEKRFIPEPNSGCWIWIGACNPHGYGSFRFNKKPGTASRAAWKIYKGPIPDSLQVLHRCDNRPCVNPDHLFLGTVTDNMRDMFRKGRRHARNAAPIAALSQQAPE